MSRKPLLLLTGALVLAVASAYAAERIDVISEGSHNDFWKAPATPLSPGYPSTVTDNDQVCVGVGYMIEKDGSTSGFMVLKSWSRAHGSGDKAAPMIEPFARNALAAVQQWKFTPAEAGKERKVYTAITFGFDKDPAVDGAALKKKCQVSNLSAFIQKAQAEAYRTGNLNKGQQDRARQESINNASQPRSGGGGG